MTTVVSQAPPWDRSLWLEELVWLEKAWERGVKFRVYTPLQYSHRGGMVKEDFFFLLELKLLK